MRNGAQLSSGEHSPYLGSKRDQPQCSQFTKILTRPENRNTESINWSQLASAKNSTLTNGFQSQTDEIKVGLSLPNLQQSFQPRD